MTTSKGHLNTAKLSSTAIGEIISYTLRLTAQKVEDTEITDEWQSFKQTVRGAAGTMLMYFDEDDASQDTIRAAILTGGASAEVANLRLEANDTGGSAAGYFTGTVLFDDIEISNPGIPGIIQMSCSYTVTGAVSYQDSAA